MPGFDPDQPRDERGQWTAGDAGPAIKSAASVAFNTKLMKGLAMAGVVAEKDFTRVLPKIAEDEDAIRNQEMEFASLYNETGVVIDKKTSGAANYVEFTDEEAAQMRGGVLTHNHPSGRSFSLNDLKLAFSKGLHSIRVAGNRDYDYEFYPGRRFDLNDDFDSERFANLYESISDQVANEMYGRLWDNEITEDYANYNHHHQVNTIFAERTGSRYIRKSNNSKGAIK